MWLGCVCTEKCVQWCVTGSLVLCVTYRDATGLAQAQDILSELDLPAGPEDCAIVHLVCSTISTRSAELTAAALATVVNRIRHNRGLDHLCTTVGVDGTVYKKHPK